MTNLQQRADYSGKTIYVGIDVHLKSWDASLFFEGQHIRSFHQLPDASQLIITLKRDYPNASFCCAYEAGFSGYSLQRQLTEAGFNCIVVNPADIPRTDKEKRTKTDRGDSKRIASNLELGKLNPIYIPDVATESRRRIVRYRQQLLRDLQRNKVRIKHFLYQQGIALPSSFCGNNWSNKFMDWLKGLSLPNPMDKRTLSKMVEQVEQQRKEINLLVKR